MTEAAPGPSARYSAWPERMLDVESLLLDEHNYRLPVIGGKARSPRDVIAELVEYENVYQLARDISKAGYLPVESLIGTIEDRGTVILEGNRRLAALKLLLNPALAPNGDERRFRALADPADRVMKVRVLLSPDRSSAAGFILRRHTRDQVRKWGPLMQARFYRDLGANSNPEELAAMLGVTAGEITDHLKTDAMYELARSIDLPPSVRDVVQDPRRFPASVLERLIEIPKARNFLALAFDDAGRPSSHAEPSAFQRAYGKILTDIVEEQIDTRLLNKVEDAETYLKKIAGVQPKPTRNSYSAAELAGTARHQPKPSTPTAPPARRRSAAALIPSYLKCTLKDERAVEVFDELKRLKNVSADRGFPNAHAVLLRLLLEFAVSNYLEKTGAMKKILDKFRKEGKKSDWYPSLRQMLPSLLAEPTISIDPRARKIISDLLSKQGNILSMDNVDAFVHSPYTLPDERRIRELWLVLAGLLEHVLHEPPKPAKP